MREAGDDSADEVKDHVLDVTVGLLDVVAEDKEKQHVPADVQPAAVHEGRRQEREPDGHRSGRLVDHDRGSIRRDNWELADDVLSGGDLGRHR